MDRQDYYGNTALCTTEHHAVKTCWLQSCEAHWVIQQWMWVSYICQKHLRNQTTMHCLGSQCTEIYLPPAWTFWFNWYNMYSAVVWWHKWTICFLVWYNWDSQNGVLSPVCSSAHLWAWATSANILQMLAASTTITAVDSEWWWWRETPLAHTRTYCKLAWNHSLLTQLLKVELFTTCLISRTLHPNMSMAQRMHQCSQLDAVMVDWWKCFQATLIPIPQLITLKAHNHATASAYCHTDDIVQYNVQCNLPFNHTLSNSEAECFQLWETILLQPDTVDF